MSVCNVRDEMGCLIESRVHDYRFVDLAGESVLFALVDCPNRPGNLVIIEYGSGMPTKVGCLKDHATTLWSGLTSEIKHYGAAETLARIKELRETEWSTANEVDF